MKTYVAVDIYFRTFSTSILVFFFLVSWGGMRLSPLGTSAINWPIVPAPDDDVDDDECGAVGGMRIGKGNRSTRRKPAPVPLRSPQISHDLTLGRTRAAAVGNRRLTASGMARPRWGLVLSLKSRHFYPWGKCCRYLLNRRPGRPKIRS
jgi:hypothetical protein